MLFLQFLHKRKGHITSGLLFIFWTMLVVFAMPQLRWEIQNYFGAVNVTSWEEFQYSLYIAYFTFIAFMLFLNCFADKQPRYTTYDKSKSMKPTPEKSSSFLNLIFFHWFTATAWIGWRRPLNENDIFGSSPENISREIVPPFDKYFEKSVAEGRR